MTLQNKYLKYVQDNKDFKIYIKDDMTPIMANKFALISTSKYFEVFFSSVEKEEKNEIVFEGKNKNILEKLINYVHGTEEIANIADKDMVTLLKEAECLGIDIGEEFNKYFSKMINNTNVYELYKEIQNINIPTVTKLTQICIDYIFDSVKNLQSGYDKLIESISNFDDFCKITGEIQKKNFMNANQMFCVLWAWRFGHGGKYLVDYKEMHTGYIRKILPVDKIDNIDWFTNNIWALKEIYDLNEIIDRLALHINKNSKIKWPQQ